MSIFPAEVYFSPGSSREEILPNRRREREGRKRSGTVSVLFFFTPLSLYGQFLSIMFPAFTSGFLLHSVVLKGVKWEQTEGKKRPEEMAEEEIMALVFALYDSKTFLD